MGDVRRILTAQLRNHVSFVLNLIDFIKLYVCNVEWRTVLYVLEKIVAIGAWKDTSLKKISVVYALKDASLVLPFPFVRFAKMDTTLF